jgi:hypothetical protein
MEVARLLHKCGMLAKRTDEKRLAVKYVPKVGSIQSYALSRVYFGRSTSFAGEPFFTVHDGGQP